MSQDNLIRMQKARFFRAFFFCCLSFGLCACATLETRKNTADDIIQEAGLHTRVLPTSPYKLFSAHNNLEQPVDRLTIIIEGDGLAWVNRYTLSDDPTPTNPVGLKIAATIKKPSIYLARPCQYISSSNCTADIWSHNRFDKTVTDSYMNALNLISQQYNVRQFDIVAYSGGAYIALLLAAGRHDIQNVTTIAGVLNPDAWTRFHDISPLNIEHDLPSLLLNTRDTGFLHICGTDDEVVPCTLTKDFIGKTASLNLDNHRLAERRGKDHEDLWEELSY